MSSTHLVKKHTHHIHTTMAAMMAGAVLSAIAAAAVAAATVSSLRSPRTCQTGVCFSVEISLRLPHCILSINTVLTSHVHAFLSLLFFPFFLEKEKMGIAFIRGLNGGARTVEYALKDGTTVGSLKSAISKEIKCPVNHLLIIMGGKPNFVRKPFIPPASPYTPFASSLYFVCSVLPVLPVLTEILFFYKKLTCQKIDCGCR